MSIFQRKHHYIGLHINNHAIKALQFEVGAKSTSLQAFSNVVMPKGLITNDEFSDYEGLSKLITKSLDRPLFGRYSTNRVVVAIPESKSFVRIIPLQKMRESEIATAITFEAESYIPLPMDQVYFDWQVLEDKGETIEVLLIASPKNYIDTYSEILENAGLKIAGIETESQSVARALVPSSVKEPILIADMDAYKTALLMVQNGTLQFTSSVPIAGNTFTQTLAKAMSLPPADAEKLKHKIGFTNTVEYPNLKTQMLPALQDLSAEIQNILKFHYDHHEDHIGRLVLTGGGAKLQHIAEAIEPMLEQYAPLKVTVANPLEHIPNLKETELGPYEALSYTTAIGLAMWEITSE